MAVTGLAVLLRAGERQLTVDIDGEPAATIIVPEEHHCVELIGLLWPDLPLEDRAEVARGGTVSTKLPASMGFPTRFSEGLARLLEDE